MSEPIRIPVYSRGRVVGDALIDAEDAYLAGYRWTYGTGYAVSVVPSADPAVSPSMHRRVCGLLRGDPRVVHHINENTLDNRRSNLQVFETMSEANRQPHPQRDQASRDGTARYLATRRAREARAA